MWYLVIVWAIQSTRAALQVLDQSIVQYHSVWELGSNHPSRIKIFPNGLLTATPRRSDICWECADHTLPTRICENLFGLSDVYELLLGFLLLLWILEVVWMPLLCQLPVGSDNLLFLGGSVTTRRVLSAHKMNLRILAQVSGYHTGSCIFKPLLC